MPIEFTHASAGSGKTYTIETAVANRLIEGTLAPHELIAVTFTIKAAAELNERISKRLIQQNQVELAARLAQARIGTVHAVCGQLLSEFAFELGLPSRLGIITDADKKQLLLEALDQSLTDTEASELDQLARRLSISDWPGDVLKIIDNARLNNLGPESLADSASESIAELTMLFPGTDPGYSSAGLRDHMITARDAGRAYLAPTKGLAGSLDTLDTLLSLPELTWKAWLDAQGLKAGKSELDIVSNLQHYGSNVMRCAEFQQDMTKFINSMFIAAANTMTQYQSLKATRGLIDFTDQEKLALDALAQPIVSDRLKDNLRYLVVDEFQDTSPIQLALFSRLSALADDVLFVGDVKQSIYGFRGADPRLALDVIQHIKDGAGTLSNLEYSWRSRPGLVHLVNELFVPAFKPLLESEQVALAPREALELDAEELAWWTLHGKNLSLRFKQFAAHLASTVTDGLSIRDKDANSVRSAHWEDIAILCRSGARVTQVAEACVAQGIPVAIEREGLLNTPEAILALACLRWLYDADDTLAAAEITSLMSGTTAQGWLEARIDAVQSDAENAASDWTQNQASHAVLQILASHRDEMTGVLSPAEAIQFAIQVGDVYQTITAWEESRKLTDHRLANLQKLKTLATEYQDHCASQSLAATVAGLLVWLRAKEQTSEDHQARNPGNAVYIGTYHSAKGLEWPVVVCTDLNKGPRVSLYGVRVRSESRSFKWDDPLEGRQLRYLPYPFGDKTSGNPLGAAVEKTESWKQVEQHAWQEALQLLYVGMTRARDQLVLIQEAVGASRVGGAGEWLELLDSPLLPPADTVHQFENGDSVRIAISGSEELELPDRLTTTRAKHWLKPHRVNPESTSLPYNAPPSGNRNATDSQSTHIVWQSGQRLDLHGSQNMDLVGTALHHCISVALLNPGIDERFIEQIIKSYPSVLLHAAEVLQAIERFRTWLLETWPGAKIHCELPYQRQLDSLQLQSGVIDLAIDTEDGWVLIDHKSYPGKVSEWEGIAAGYAGQMRAYCEAVESFGSKPVLGCFIHFAVGGGAVKLEYNGG